MSAKPIKFIEKYEICWSMARYLKGLGTFVSTGKLRSSATNYHVLTLLNLQKRAKKVAVIFPTLQHCEIVAGEWNSTMRFSLFSREANAVRNKCVYEVITSTMLVLLLPRCGLDTAPIMVTYVEIILMYNKDCISLHFWYPEPRVLFVISACIKV